jgi:hypothetical protein
MYHASVGKDKRYEASRVLLVLRVMRLEKPYNSENHKLQTGSPASPVL